MKFDIFLDFGPLGTFCPKDQIKLDWQDCIFDYLLIRNGLCFVTRKKKVKNAWDLDLGINYRNAENLEAKQENLAWRQKAKKNKFRFREFHRSLKPETTETKS